MHSSVAAAKIIVKTGPQAGRVVDLTGQELVVGRSQPAGLIIQHPEVSRQHLRLRPGEAGYLIEDLGSSNGTFLNDQRLTAPRLLHDGDTIRLGREVGLVFSAVSDLATGVPVSENAAGATHSPDTSHEGTLLEVEAIQPARASRKTAVHPRLVVTIAGQADHEYELSKPRVSLGRAEDNDIVINSLIVSRHHAILEQSDSGYALVVIPGATNTFSCQGRPVVERRQLVHGDVLRIDSEVPGMMVTMRYLVSQQEAFEIPININFGDKEKLVFGRDPSNDVVLNMPNISRYHTQVTRVGRRYYVTDLRSTNGTYVNDRRVEGDIWLEKNDTIRIGAYRFVLGEDMFTQYHETEGVRVEAYHLNKWVRKDLNLLQDISLTFQPREFIAVVGQSGGGKSTLIDSIAGYRPPTHGHVFVNDINVLQNFDLVRSMIGYVPQKDIIHMELTVYQALDFAARLRMPRDTSPAERHTRIMEVLEDLDLLHRKDVEISGLSGGQQKRVSIGVELLTRPGLFFLDEPTSGLDPGTETAFMHLMRRLADQGRTIVMVTHATKNVMLADKVVFLARGGYLAWFGPPNEALEYFDQYRSDQERRTRPMEFDQIYAILDDPARGNASEWHERFCASAAFQQYIVQPLQAHAQKVAATKKMPVSRTSRKKGSRISSVHQFMVLSRRNLAILLRDRSSLILMLVAAPAVGALDLILAPVMGRAPFSYADGNAANGGITLFLLTIYALLVGGMSQMREFVKESDIYKRERLVNLRIVPYVTSKVWIALLLSFYHGLAYTLLHYLAFKMPGGTAEFIQVYITMVLATMTGMMLGLVASSLAPNAASAPLTMIMMIVPLIVLSGALAPVPPAISQVASTRWAFEGLLGIVGAGSDVAADACWQLDEDLREAMTLDDKAYFQCRCMGVNIFKEDVCSFPGVGTYYAAEIDQPAPTEPPPLPPQPPEPVIPPAPEPPEDKYDQVKMAQYLNSLSSYQDTVKDIQDNYRNQIDLYQSMADVYEGQMTKYIEDLARYNIARVSAVKGGEGIIGSVTEQYGWAWVNKNDPARYFPWLFQAWLAQLEIVAVYYIIILVMIKRKDVK